MTKTSSSPPSKHPVNAPKNSRKIGIKSNLITFIFRLLIIIVGSGLAWLGGIILANYYSQRNSDEIPLITKIWYNTNKIIARISSSINQSKQLTAQPEIAREGEKTQLTPEEKQQKQAELKQLQTELNNLIGRTNNLENQLGKSNPNKTLENRIQILSQQLNTTETLPEKSAESPLPTISPRPTPTSANNNQKTDNNPKPKEALMVTLPSDYLFPENSNQLKQESQPILDNLIAEIQNYPGATIRINAHTDNSSETNANRSISMQRAQTLEQYLKNILGDRYRWVSMGYGDSRPLVENNNDTSRQRNRRIEISIEP